MSEDKTQEQVEIEKKELRIAQLETRIQNIDKLLADRESKATFPAIKTVKEELVAESIKIYGELSPFYVKQ